MLSRAFDIKHWRTAVLIAFVAAMLVTPADPTSMVLAALALCGVWFLGAGLRAFLGCGSRSGTG